MQHNPTLDRTFFALSDPTRRRILEQLARGPATIGELAAGHTITVDGNVTATDANSVLMRGLTVNGNVMLTGGGGEIPWSIKGNTIAGNVTITGVTADCLGLQFNGIGRNATLTKITATDPGDPGRTVAVVENTVARNLSCTGLAPGVSGGVISGEVNHVGHNANGQCASVSAPLI